MNTIRKDSYVAPVIIPITAGNQPKVVKAGRLIIRINSLNGGDPFFTNYGTEIKVSTILTMKSVR